MAVEQVSGSAWAECPNGVESASKRTKARIEATLDASVARHKVLLQEHRAEIEVIEGQH
jgi:hypothetical protein